ncbi:hypothetical protein MKB28_003703 [Salmonella enterica]|nr:hypothetical protein [Salmonella enterica]
MSKITLTAAMIQSLASFAAKDGHAAYTLAHGHIPAQADFAGYSGLIAYSVSDDGGVLALEEVHEKSRVMPYTEEMKLYLMRLIINDDIEGLNNALNSSMNLIQGKA